MKRKSIFERLIALSIMAKVVSFALIALALAVIIFAATSMGTKKERDKLRETYVSLGSSVHDSKYDFEKKIYFLSTLDGETLEEIRIVSPDGTIMTGDEHKEEITQDNTVSDSVTGGSAIKLSADAAAVEEKLRQAGYVKASAMAYAYEILNPTLGTNAAIGLMANICNEGNFGIVEYSFSSSASTSHYYHNHSFRLPSGGSKVATRADLDYLKNESWDTTSKHQIGTNKDGSPRYCSPGSCGLGCIQWSYNRRLGLVEEYYKALGSGDTVTEEIMKTAECNFMFTELAVGGNYYTNVSKVITSGTCEEWAEAFCDYYELPGGWCGKGKKMTGVGTACQKRKESATQIAQVLQELM